MSRWIRLLPAMAAYFLLMAAGVIILFIPSPSLSRQGGYIVALVWIGFCIAGGLSGLVGLVFNHYLLRLIGAALAASASLTWTVALVLQAVKTHQVTAAGAACLAGVMTLLFTQRWVDAYRESRK